MKTRLITVKGKTYLDVFFPPQPFGPEPPPMLRLGEPNYDQRMIAEAFAKRGLKLKPTSTFVASITKDGLVKARVQV